jgi:hypothetical protein
MENKDYALSEFVVKQLRTQLKRPVKIDVTEGRRGYVVNVVDAGLGITVGSGRAKTFEAALRAAEAEAAETIVF